jgi:hypothetical protein
MNITLEESLEKLINEWIKRADYLDSIDNHYGSGTRKMALELKDHLSKFNKTNRSIENE